MPPGSLPLHPGHAQPRVKIMGQPSASVSTSAKPDQGPARKCCLRCSVAALTISHSRHLVLQRQDQLGLPREVLAAALLVLQHGGDAPGKVV